MERGNNKSQVFGSKETKGHTQHKPSIRLPFGLVTIRCTFHVSLGVQFQVHYTQLIMSFYEAQMFIIYENHRHFQYP